MKKIFFLVLVFVALNLMLHASAQAQGFDWGRVGVGVDCSYQPSTLLFRSGLLRNHPERSAHLQLNYRLWRRWEVGVYTNIRGSEISYSGNEVWGTGSSDKMSFVAVENGYEVGWGTLVQWHAIPYDEKNNLDVDIVLRAGMDISQLEADIWWGGIGVYYQVDKHLSLYLCDDFGTFHYGRMNDVVVNQSTWHWRFSLGVQLQL